MKRDLNLIFSNDIHGNYNTFNAMSILKRKIDNNICLDAGDTFSYDFDGKIIEGMLNKVVDIWLPGNHDLETHYNNFLNICNKKKVEVLLSNVKKNEKYNIKHWIEKKINGLNVLFLGCTTFSFNDKVEFVDLARKTIEIIYKKKNESDLVVFLSHLGINEDIRLAEALPEIDVIVGGHSHTRINGAKLVNKTLIVQAGGFGKEIGVLNLIIKNKKIISYESELMQVSEFKPETYMLEIVENTRSNYNSFMNIKNDLYYKKYLDNPFIDIVLKNILENSEADGVILNSSLINVELTRGNITIEDVKRIIGYKTFLYYVFLSGKEIRDVLKRSKKDIYFKLHAQFNAELKEKNIYKIIVTDFLAKGGHYGGSLFPEIRDKNKKEANVDIIEMAKKSLEEAFYE